MKILKQNVRINAPIMNNLCRKSRTFKSATCVKCVLFNKADLGNLVDSSYLYKLFVLIFEVMLVCVRDSVIGDYHCFHSMLAMDLT